MLRARAFFIWFGIAILIATTVFGAAARGLAAAHATRPTHTAQLERLLPELPLNVTLGAGPPGRTFVVLMSGDGGWSGFDRALAQGLARAGWPVVGWDAQAYFGLARTPGSSAADLQRVIDTYGARFQRQRVVLVGFSFGASAMPFMAERLPETLRRRIAGVALISPTQLAQFRFSPLDWVIPPRQGLAVAPAIARLDPRRTLCAYGARDEDSVCAHLPRGGARTLARPGGHHLSGGDDAELVRAIMDVAGEPYAA